MQDSLFLKPKDYSIKRLEFHLVQKCVCSCVFCSEQTRMNAFKNDEFSYEEAVEILIKFAEEGVKHLNVTGGEPTLFPQLPQLLNKAKSLGYTTYMATNGVKTKSTDYFVKIAPSLDELCLSVHAADAKTHDSLTGLAGSFDGLMKTLDNAQKYCDITKMKLFFNSVASRRNAEDVWKVVNLAAERGAAGCLISSLAPEGEGLKNYRNLALRFADWPLTADKCVKALGKASASLRFFSVPTCLLGEHRIMSNDLYFDPRITVERIALPNGEKGTAVFRSFKAARGRVLAAACQGCRYNKTCMGAFAEHLKTFPEDERLLKPL